MSPTAAAVAKVVKPGMKLTEVSGVNLVPFGLESLVKSKQSGGGIVQN